MREDWPDFDSFTLRELYESRDGIDAKRFPDRLAYVEALIAGREAGEIPEPDDGAPAAAPPPPPKPAALAGKTAPTSEPEPQPAMDATLSQAGADVAAGIDTLVVRRLTTGTVVRLSTIASVVLALITFVAYMALAVLLMVFGGNFPAPDAVALAGNLFAMGLAFLIFFVMIVLGAAISGAITGLTMALGLWIYARYEPLALKFVPASPTT